LPPEYKKMLSNLDPLNVTTDHFINAGLAWKQYRQGRVSPNRFGIDDEPLKYALNSLYGPRYMRGQLLRDFAALNKIECAPFLVRLKFGEDWKAWRLMSADDDELENHDLKLLDHIADLCADPGGRLEEINKLFQETPDLQPA